MFKITTYIFITIFILAFTACGKFSKIVKSTDLNEKYKAAEAYYLKGDYYHAQQLFDELVTYYRGTTAAEKIYYYYAYSFYGLNDYTSAAFYFKTFSTTYPHSKFAKETQYMSAYCSYLIPPVYYLDQTNTYSALKELQLFVDLYPKSDTVAICNKLMDDLRGKLETKEFEISKLYYKIENYKAAIVAFKNTLKDYPDSKYKEDCFYYILKANYLYADNSIESKKLERYQSTLEAYQALVEAFPQSQYIRDAESVNKNTLKEINKITKPKS